MFSFHIKDIPELAPLNKAKNKTETDILRDPIKKKQITYNMQNVII